MNELTKEKTMTVKEISEISGVSYTVIGKKTKQLFPEIVKNGKTTHLNKIQSTKIINEIKKKGFIKPIQNEEVAIQNKKLNKDMVLLNLLTQMQNQQNQFMLKVLDRLDKIERQPKQIEIRQDYYSILAYCKINKLDISFSEAIRFGKIASRLSREKNLEIRKVPDERFGNVNSYSIDVLNKVFEL